MSNRKIQILIFSAVGVLGLLYGTKVLIASFFYLQLDDVRIYNRVLTESEILKLYKMGEAKVNASPTNKLTNGLVGYWTFDGKDTNWTSATAGTVADRSPVGTNTGTLTNMSRSTSPVIGKIGQGLMFDGGDDLINAGSGSSLDRLDLTGMTVSLWTRQRSTGEGNVQPILIAKDANYNSTGWRFHGANSVGVLSFVARYNGAQNLSVNSANSTLSPTSNTWTHLVATWDGTTDYVGTHIYKDGQEVSYGTRANGAGDYISDANDSLGISGTATSQRTHNGLLDEVRVYNRVLTVDEVKQLYNMGR